MAVIKPKYEIGQKVKFFQDTDAQAGVILSYSYDPKLKTFRYIISAKQVNLAEEKVEDAVKHCLEDELVEVKNE